MDTAPPVDDIDGGVRRGPVRRHGPRDGRPSAAHVQDAAATPCRSCRSKAPASSSAGRSTSTWSSATPRRSRPTSTPWTCSNIRPLIPLQIDPPDHKKFRKLLDPIFAPREVAKLEESLVAAVERAHRPVHRPGRGGLLRGVLDAVPDPGLPRPPRAPRRRAAHLPGHEGRDHPAPHGHRQHLREPRDHGPPEGDGRLDLRLLRRGARPAGDRSARTTCSAGSSTPASTASDSPARTSSTSASSSSSPGSTR